MMSRRLAAALFATQLDAPVHGAEQHENSPDTPAYEVAAVYTGEVWRNAHGGLRTGGVYLDNIDLTLAVDGERAWGIPGLSAFVYVLHNNDARLSERYVGDAMTASNIDTFGATRLYEAWLEWQAGTAQPLSLRVGLYDLNSEFDVSDTRALFINSSHGVGHELGQTGLNGPSIFPVTSLSLRAAWEPADRWRVLAAVLDGVPGDPDHPSSTRVRLSSEDGALVISEIQWLGERLRKLSLGHWHYTARFDDLRSTPEQPFPRRRDNSGSYSDIEIALGSLRQGEVPSTSAFLRYGVANGRINEFTEFLGVGVRSRGLIPSRPDDEAGLAYSKGRIGSVTRALALQAGELRDRAEQAVELTYRATVNEWLTLQPDLQLILDPGADPSLDDSVIFGLRFEISLTVPR